jgi:hypothetical protein
MHITSATTTTTLLSFSVYSTKQLIPLLRQIVVCKKYNVDFGENDFSSTLQTYLGNHRTANGQLYIP